jgi:benzoyl-CoA reductase/2-hydroxyglutaryl-CoA dehydratase subunit BcrC/BadD/HgdB
MLPAQIIVSHEGVSDATVHDLVLCDIDRKVKAMEDKLQKLMSAGGGGSRTDWARAWQAQGGKVIGVLDGLVPEEAISAAGMLPWRIQGTWNADISQAMVYRLPHASTFLHHVMQSLLDGELDFLDGMACSDRDEDFLNFADYWEHVSHVPLVDIVEVPVIDTDASRRRFAETIRKFMQRLGDFNHVQVSDSMLRETMTLYRKRARLLKDIYEMRKRETPPLSGGEAMALVGAAMVMPRDEFTTELEELLPYLSRRQAAVSSTRPRILVSSDLLVDPRYLDLVEDAGGLVAMDDMDTGSRYFWEAADADNEDPVAGLARQYLNNHAPRMYDWRGQAARLTAWAQDFGIEGVLELPDTYDYTRGFRKPYLERYMREAGIPSMSFDRDYHFSNAGQLKTKIEAFIEVLSQAVEN